MRDCESVPIVLVVAHESILNNIREALANTAVALLHAPTKQEAIAFLEHLRSEISLAIIELESPDHVGGWDLIRRLAFVPEKPVKLIVTTSTYPQSSFGKIKEIGADAVVPKEIPLKAWRLTVETVLGTSEYTH